MEYHDEQVQFMILNLAQNQHFSVSRKTKTMVVCRNE